ncbi:MAG: hydantoinase B/oxoprolinase family protein, partial [Gammaproteobacteria bacterium]
GGRDWAPGEMVVVNDPFLGGTHLPDVTIIAPLFDDERLMGFVANRAHHADIGAESPGSMPISQRLDEEGIVIPPTLLVAEGEVIEDIFSGLLERLRDPALGRGDFSAQISANRAGLTRLGELVESFGVAEFRSALVELNDYAERLAESALRTIPDGRHVFTDRLDDDGVGNHDLPISVTVTVKSGRVEVDFAGTAAQTTGNVNCPLPVTAAAVFYVFRCLMPPQTPGCAGSFRGIRLRAEEGSLVHARRPAAVAAGNVETSSRIVDAVLGALAPALPERIPAASQGTMNNLAMGGQWHGHPWDYYETLGGGTGAHAHGDGLDAVQSHMTNTLNTPIETLESHYPVRIHRYSIRRGSGGAGGRRGGDGLVREFEFLGPARVTLLTERRRHAPWGLGGGQPGAAGVNRLNGMTLPSKAAVTVAPGDRLTIETPGGGGWSAGS